MRNLLVLVFVLAVTAGLLKLRLEIQPLSGEEGTGQRLEADDFSVSPPDSILEQEEAADQWLLPIIESWDFDAFEQLIHPEIKRRLPRQGVHALFHAVASRLGPLQEYHYYAIQGASHRAFSGNGQSLYGIRAIFFKGEADIEVRLIHERGGYWIDEFVVSSEVLEKVNAAAEEAYREGRFDEGRFYYEVFR